MSAGAMRNFHSSASWSPHDRPKREVSVAEVRDALARRERGQGWQTIAKVLAISVVDLRIACGDETLDPAFRAKASAPVARRAKPKRGEGRLVTLLESIEDGAGSAAAVFRNTSLGNADIFDLLSGARSEGLVEGDGHAGTLRLTDIARTFLEARRG